MSTQQPVSIESLSFEQALQELEIIVRQLEEGRVSLDQSIKAYERGNALKAHCANKLKAAKMRIDQISLDDQGAVTQSESPLQQLAE